MCVWVEACRILVRTYMHCEKGTDNCNVSAIGCEAFDMTDLIISMNRKVIKPSIWCTLALVRSVQSDYVA